MLSCQIFKFGLIFKNGPTNNFRRKNKLMLTNFGKKHFRTINIRLRKLKKSVGNSV